MPEEALNHTQAFQQAIATTITCRTLIKYNSNLSTEQKEEILGEIETTLAFLGQRLEVNVSSETNNSPLAEQPLDLSFAETMIVDENGETLLLGQQPADQPDEHEIPLSHLYRIYRAYFSNEPSKGILDLGTRYKTVMSVIDQLQEMAELRHSATASDLTINELLCRVRGFVTALYCMFREFAVLLSKVVDGQSIDIDTEAMALLPEHSRAPEASLPGNMAPLIHVYNKQHQLQERRGPLHESARDASAFLIFLQECLEQTFARRQEIVSQIKSTALLLSELSTLVTDYEAATANLMQSPSRPS